ncbi:MAG: hypothetical protein ACOVK5_00485 [Ilumatobacteraceae bacterium]|jgi:hypothetical protein
MMENMHGSLIIKINVAMTALFVVASVVAAAAFSQPWKSIAVVVSLACFTIGITVFLWGYWTAVQRSRTDEISVAAMYFLVDGAAPSKVAAILNSTLAVQVVVAVATAIARSSTDGKAGSTLAFGILVPMMGLGFNGLWASIHGSFSPRQLADGAQVPHPDTQSGQD